VTQQQPPRCPIAAANLHNQPVAVAAILADDQSVGPGVSLRKGARVVVRGRSATFVKAWGERAAIIRYDDAPDEPKVVPLEWLTVDAPQSS
jgi:hypothetical protein